MKKLALVLASLMAVGLLTACNSAPSTPADSGGSQPASQQTTGDGL